MNRSEDGEATRRWAEAERLAAGLPSEIERSWSRRAWAFIILTVLIFMTLSGAAAFLLPQNLLGDAVAVPDWLKTTGYIIEAAILLGITIWGSCHPNRATAHHPGHGFGSPVAHATAAHRHPNQRS